MQILAALFVEGLDQRQVDGPATRLDLLGVMFSVAAPSPPPVTLSPHLVVITRCGPDEDGSGTLVVEFKDESGSERARNVQPVSVVPGKFGRHLVKGDLTFDDYGTVEAHCQLDSGQPVVVPLTLLAPPS